MYKFKTTIEVEVGVKYAIEPAQKGSCDSMGVPEEPSWDAFVDDIEVVYPEELDSETMEQLKKECKEHQQEEGE